MSDPQELESTREKKGPTVAVDQAWDYLEAHGGGAAATEEPYSLKALRRKIDLRIVPLMFFCYTMQFIDKVLINVSNESLLSDYLEKKILKSLRLVCSCHGPEPRPQSSRK